MRFNQCRGSVIALLAWALLFACRPVPIRSSDFGPLPSAQKALENLRQRASQIAGIQSLGRVSYFGDQGRIRLKAVLLAQRPTKFRIETLSPFGQPLQVMVSNGSRLSLLSEGQFYVGRSNAENVARILTLPLSPSDLVDALLGGVPMDERFVARKIEWADDIGEKIRLTLIARPSGEQLVLEYEKSSQQVRRLRLPARGPHPELIIELSKLEALPPPAKGYLARRIRITMPSQNHEVTLKLKDARTNIKMNPNSFTLTPPEGILPIDLDFARTSTQPKL
jgi:outer membrane lipoprotein-sorting protein